jgi:single-strand DNA-binding protein
MRETYMCVSGVVASEPRVTHLDDGRQITSFRLASTSRKKDGATNAWVDGPTLWLTVTCWRELAVNTAGSVHKRDRVLVNGRVRTRDWTSQDGERRTAMELDADSLGHDLAFGTTEFTRRVRAVPERPGQAQADELASRVAEEGLDDRRPTAEELRLSRSVLEAVEASDHTADDEGDEFDEEMADVEADEGRTLVGAR